MRRDLGPLAAALAALVAFGGAVVATQSTHEQSLAAATDPSPSPTDSGIPAATASPSPGAASSASPTASPTTSTTSTTGIDPALTDAVRAAMGKATASRWTAYVDVQGRGATVDLDGTRWMLPASTEKLFTTLPFLLSRPGDRLATTVATTRPVSAGVVRGDLVVHSAADPMLAGYQLVALAKQVRAAGVRRVTGHLVLDIASLPSQRTRVGWKSSYVPADVAPLSPFPVHGDTWRRATSYVLHPTGGNLALFRQKLTAAGVRVDASSYVSRSAPAGTVIASTQSPTIAAIVAHTLRASDNFVAEQLLNIEGWAPVRSLAKQVGAQATESDGSGLSLRDRRSAVGLVRLLEYAHASAASSLLQRSLPVACSSGTLKHDFCGTVAAGQVWAKTGTLSHVKVLAGYTTDAAGRWVTFAFMTSGDASTSRAMNAIEHAVLALRHYRS